MIGVAKSHRFSWCWTFQGYRILQTDDTHRFANNLLVAQTKLDFVTDLGPRGLNPLKSSVRARHADAMKPCNIGNSVQSIIMTCRGGPRGCRTIDTSLAAWVAVYREPYYKQTSLQRTPTLTGQVR